MPPINADGFKRLHSIKFAVYYEVIMNYGDKVTPYSVCPPRRQIRVFLHKCEDSMNVCEYFVNMKIR